MLATWMKTLYSQKTVPSILVHRDTNVGLGVTKQSFVWNCPSKSRPLEECRSVYLSKDRVILCVPQSTEEKKGFMCYHVSKCCSVKSIVKSLNYTKWRLSVGWSRPFFKSASCTLVRKKKRNFCLSYGLGDSRLLSISCQSIDHNVPQHKTDI